VRARRHRRRIGLLVAGTEAGDGAAQGEQSNQTMHDDLREPASHASKVIHARRECQG
jgi:hypothetical protein